MEEKMALPMDIAFDQGRQEIAHTINYVLSELRVPMFMIEVILKDLLGEVSAQARSEYQKHVQEYNASLQQPEEEANPTEEVVAEQE